MRSEPVVLGVDVGATKILAGAVTVDGRILASRRFPMQRHSTASTLDCIQNAIGEFLHDWTRPTPRALGLGLVGNIDAATGTWLEAMNLPIPDPVPLGPQLSDRFGLAVAMDNDVHAATRAELRWGIGQQSADFIYLNVGTGISAGLVFGGQLVRGMQNYAGELGHMVVDPQGPPCPCGRHGCLETLASGGGLLTRLQELLASYPESALRTQPDTAQAIFLAAESGDPLAVRLADQAVEALDIALTNLVNLLNPEWIIYGGGVLSDGWLMDRVRPRVEAGPLRMARRSLKGILPSGLQTESVGLLGAACLALDLLGGA